MNLQRQWHTEWRVESKTLKMEFVWFDEYSWCDRKSKQTLQKCETALTLQYGTLVLSFDITLIKSRKGNKSPNSLCVEKSWTNWSKKVDTKKGKKDVGKIIFLKKVTNTAILFDDALVWTAEFIDWSDWFELVYDLWVDWIDLVNLIDYFNEWIQYIIVVNPESNISYLKIMWGVWPESNISYLQMYSENPISHG